MRKQCGSIRAAASSMRVMSLSAVVAGLACASAARGAFTVYTDRAAFNSAAGALGTLADDGYETYPNDVQAGARAIALSGFNVSYDLNGDDSEFGITDIPNVNGGQGIGPTAGTKYLVANYPTSAVPAGASVTFSFPSPTTAFGIDIKDLENASMSYSTASGLSGTAATPGADGNVQFFGIISTDQPFNSIALSELGLITGDGIAFDETAHVVVPEPSSLLLLAVGMPLIRRRRR